MRPPTEQEKEMAVLCARYIKLKAQCYALRLKIVGEYFALTYHLVMREYYLVKYYLLTGELLP